MLLGLIMGIFIEKCIKSDIKHHVMRITMFSVVWCGVVLMKDVQANRVV